MGKCLLISLLILISPFISNGQTTSTWFRTTDTVQYVSLGDLDIVGDKITVEARVYRESPGADIVSKHRNTLNVNYLLRLGNAQITTGVTGSTNFYSVSSCQSLNDNTFYHVAFTYDGSFLKYFVNGGEAASTPATGDLFQNDFNTKIGYIGWMEYGNTTGYINGPTIAFHEQWRGYIDEVRIWNIARPQDSLDKYKSIPLPAPSAQTGLVAYYSLNSTTNLQGNSAWDGVLAGSGTLGNTLTLPTLVSPACALNVNLLSFEGSYDPHHVEVDLLWKSGSETRSDHFVIEKQENNSWVEIGKVNAAGNSTTITEYSYKYYENKAGTYLYRLKMVDIEGYIEYSRIINIDVAPEDKVFLYPNPANDSFRIDYFDEKITSVSLYSSTGKVIADLELMNNNEVMLEGISDGYYTVKIFTENNMVILPLMVNKHK